MTDRKLVAVVEDELSGNICSRILLDYAPDVTIDRMIIARGFGNIKSKVHVYERASRFVRHLVLTDLDNHHCAPKLRESWAIQANTSMIFRVAVREVEAWVMADRDGFSDFFGVPCGKIPNQIELDPDPKARLISLVRKSKASSSRGIAPEPGAKAKVGPMYNHRLGEFVTGSWSPQNAMARAPSLERMVLRLTQFASV